MFGIGWRPARKCWGMRRREKPMMAICNKKSWKELLQKRPRLKEPEPGNRHNRDMPMARMSMRLRHIFPFLMQVMDILGPNRLAMGIMGIMGPMGCQVDQAANIPDRLRGIREVVCLSQIWDRPLRKCMAMDVRRCQMMGTGDGQLDTAHMTCPMYQTPDQLQLSWTPMALDNPSVPPSLTCKHWPASDMMVQYGSPRWRTWSGADLGMLGGYNSVLLLTIPPPAAVVEGGHGSCSSYRPPTAMPFRRPFKNTWTEWLVAAATDIFGCNCWTIRDEGNCTFAWNSAWRGRPVTSCAALMLPGKWHLHRRWKTAPWCELCEFNHRILKLWIPKKLPEI